MRGQALRWRTGKHRSGHLAKGKGGQNSSNGIMHRGKNKIEAKGKMDSSITSSTLNVLLAEGLGRGVSIM